MAAALQRLGELQQKDGGWSWFPGGRCDNLMTLYIATGFGRLRHLGVKPDFGDGRRSEASAYGVSHHVLEGLDAWMNNLHEYIVAEGHPNDNHLSPVVAYYLYGRSFFLGSDDEEEGGNGDARPRCGGELPREPRRAGQTANMVKASTTSLHRPTNIGPCSAGNRRPTRPWP